MHVGSNARFVWSAAGKEQPDEVAMERARTGPSHLLGASPGNSTGDSNPARPDFHAGRFTQLFSGVLLRPGRPERRPAQRQPQLRQLHQLDEQPAPGGKGCARVPRVVLNPWKQHGLSTTRGTQLVKRRTPRNGLRETMPSPPV